MLSLRFIDSLKIKATVTNCVLIASVMVVSACSSNEPSKTVKVEKAKMPVAAVETKQKQDLSWTTPKAWKSKTASSMRVGSFTVPGANDKAADASIVILGGVAGGELANVNRWRGQLGLTDWSDAELKQKRQAVKGALGDFVWFELGPAKEAQEVILAAIIPYQERSVFVKLRGPKDVVQANRSAFVALSQSIKGN